jgi:hypothetical protein
MVDQNQPGTTTSLLIGHDVVTIGIDRDARDVTEKASSTNYRLGTARADSDHRAGAGWRSSIRHDQVTRLLNRDPARAYKHATHANHGLGSSLWVNAQNGPRTRPRRTEGVLVGDDDVAVGVDRDANWAN